KDPHVPTYPASVRVYNVHNHNISVAEALRHRDVGAKAIETLTQLFEIGHNPTSALAVLKSDLLAEHGDKYVYVSANRALCPDLHFCYRYKRFLTYLQNLYSRREFWALSYREDLPTRGNQTNNYVEAAMRVLKDKILQRTKAFNLPQLFHLFTSRLESYYEARVTDVALGRWEAFQQSRFLATESNIEPSDICQVGERKFEVKASTSGQTYAVDMELELCTCPVGHTGAPCKHQAAVVKNYKVHSNNFLPTTPEMRAELLKITGASVSLDFLQPLRQSQLKPGTLAPEMPQWNQVADHQLDQEVEFPQLASPSVCSSVSPSSLHPPPTPPSSEGSLPLQLGVPIDSEGAIPSDSPALVREMLRSLGDLADNTTFSPALTAMAKQFEKMKNNPARLVSAFYSFGKGVTPVSKRAAALRRAARRPGPIIGCQPTAVARRATINGSKRRLMAGRPRLTNSGPEHPYSRPPEKLGK
ncbi:hypothetical protein SKAU_G00368360, partial [Synaphobranchus kaupii]